MTPRERMRFQFFLKQGVSAPAAPADYWPLIAALALVALAVLR